MSTITLIDETTQLTAEVDDYKTIVASMREEISKLTTERDEYREKYNSTYSALDDCARAHNSVADERDVLKDAAKLALDALERPYADAYLDQPAIAALKAVL